MTAGQARANSMSEIILTLDILKLQQWYRQNTGIASFKIKASSSANTYTNISSSLQHFTRKNDLSCISLDLKHVSEASFELGVKPEPWDMHEHQLKACKLMSELLAY